MQRHRFSSRRVLQQRVGALAISAMLVAVPGVVAQTGAGALDPSFGDGGWALAGVDLAGDFGDTGRCVAVRDDGVIVVAGHVATASGWDWAVRWLAPDGSLDLSFGNGGTTVIPFSIPGGTANNVVGGCELLGDGQLVVVGSIDRVDGSNHDMAVARLTDSGALDLSFGDGGTVVVPFDLGGRGEDYGAEVAMQDDGMVVVAGSVQISDASYDVGVVRLTPDGDLDPGFGAAGTVTVAFDLAVESSDFATGVAIQPDGRIVLCGTVGVDSSNMDIGAARLEADGDLDPSFASDGVTTVAFDLTANGEDSAAAVAVLDDGKILLAGTASVPQGVAAFAAVRLTADGALDPAFDGDGKATLPPGDLGEQGDNATSLAVQANGALVVAGFTDNEPLRWQVVVGRFLPSGEPDPSFGTGGRVAVNVGPGPDDYGVANDVALQPDNRVVIAGYAVTTATTAADFAIVRLLNDLVFADGFEAGDLAGWSAQAAAR